MRMKNLCSWAGLTYSYERGDIVELPEDTVHERVAQHLGDYICEEDRQRRPAKIPVPAPSPKLVAQRAMFIIRERKRKERAERSQQHRDRVAQWREDRIEERNIAFAKEATKRDAENAEIVATYERVLAEEREKERRAAAAYEQALAEERKQQGLT
ncbi:MAG: hypothetical protein ACREHV_05535 [Rhizomicrobium sp.]